MATPLFCSINYQYMSDLHCNSCLERITFNIICMRTVKMKKNHTYETLPEHENKVLVFQYQIYSDMIILYVEKLVLSH